jgi:hypothetical protein
MRREPLRDEATERNAANVQFSKRLRADNLRQLFRKILDRISGLGGGEAPCPAKS